MMGTKFVLRLFSIVLLSTALFALPSVQAGELQINLLDQNGDRIKDVVVMLYPRDGQAVPPRPAAAHVMAQQNMAFAPHILPVHINSTVAFPNQDKTRHHVYSFSKAKIFELRLYDGEAERKVEFDVPGVVVLGCNIHDNMLGYIYVSDTPHFVQSDDSGFAQFSDIPEGEYGVSIWHPRMRNKAEDLLSTFTITADETLSLERRLSLRRERRTVSPY